MSSPLSEDEQLQLALCLSVVELDQQDPIDHLEDSADYQEDSDDSQEDLDDDDEPPTSQPPIDRTVLLVGGIGNGKSTVGNVLAGKEKFAEGSYGVSQTQTVTERIVQIKYNQQTYAVKIIDTIGIGDGKLSPEQVLLHLAEVSDFCKDGIHQVFFVTKDRFSAAEKDAWTVVQELIFQEDVIEYTTIVRTHVDPDNLANPTWIAKDRQKLCEGEDEVASIFRRVGERVLYVCNPNKQSRVHEWAELRQQSRGKLLRHLIENCDRLYRPQQLDAVNERIGAYLELLRLKEREACELMEEKQRLQAALDAGRQQQRELEENSQKQSTMREELKTEFQVISAELRESFEQHDRLMQQELEKQREDNQRLQTECLAVQKKLDEAKNKKTEARASILEALRSMTELAKSAELILKLLPPAAAATRALLCTIL